MIGFVGLVLVFVALSIVSVLVNPSSDKERIVEARRMLKNGGFHYAKGSDEERRALRILLDGGALEEC